MESILFDNVTKGYDGGTALEWVDLRIESGTTTAIVGPSGAGKSTLLQCVNGLVRPDDGVVEVYGKPIDYRRLPALRRRIGYSVQGTGLFPHLVVWDNIVLIARVENWDEDRTRERALSLMDLVGLSRGLRKRYPHELSGGEQQRVGLCRAMMLNPRIFLLDEPFAAVDPVTRAEIHEEFLHLQRLEPRTVVLVTHDLREAAKLAERLVVMNAGRVVQHGGRDDVMSNPGDEFVDGFFRSQLEG